MGTKHVLNPMVKAIPLFSSLLLLFLPGWPIKAAPDKGRPVECVILLHGMGRTKFSMRKIEKLLSAKGFYTVNVSYPSTSIPIEDIAQTHIPKAAAQCDSYNADKIHFVTHSLGGIVARHYLQHHTLPSGSRVVMLSPPNQGSEIADFLKNLWLYKKLMGPAGQQLGKGADCISHTLKPIAAEVGIITGNKSLNPIFSRIIDGEDDGKVSVDEARLSEMADFLVVPCNHTFIMRNKDVLQQIVHFLMTGRFNHQ